MTGPTRRAPTEADIERVLAAAKAAAEQAAADSRVRRKELLADLSGARRRKDAKRKILAGAWLFDQAARHTELHARMMTGLGTWLTRAFDRAAFGLAPLSPPPEAATSPQ